MDEWGVVVVLVSLAGLFATVGAPMLRLGGTITRLQTVLEELKKDHDREKEDNRQTHARLDDGLRAQDKRIWKLETKQTEGQGEWSI